MFSKMAFPLKLMTSAPCGPRPNQKSPTKIVGKNIMTMQKKGMKAMANLAEGNQKLQK